MKAHVELGASDLETLARHAGHASMWKISVTPEGLLVDWGDPHVKLFFAWDHVETTQPDPPPTTGKAHIVKAVDEGGKIVETMPGLDADILKWTREAGDDS